MKRIVIFAALLPLTACGEMADAPMPKEDAPKIEHVFPELADEEPRGIPEDVQATIDKLPPANKAQTPALNDNYELERRVEQIVFERGQEVFE